MRPRWKTLFVQIAFWAATEIVFNWVGVNDLANYSEFILDRKLALTEMPINISILAHS